MGIGTFTELTAARDDIDTSDYLSLIPAYQKCFVINNSRLRVADFHNVKLTCTALTTPHAPGDVLTQDQGSSKYAYMVVDFTNTAKTLVYGSAYYAGGATAFNTANSVTGNGSGTAFTPTAVTNPPHWYDYTVYQGNSTSYGSLPSKATIGCLYRGRVVLSGNEDIPHAWWMSKVGQPFKFLYDLTNDGALSACVYTNALTGQIGDIVTALIPQKDDLLVFGCANSVWVLVGDPLSNGQLAQASSTTGIYSSTSWCVDNNGILRFLGNDGIYQMNLAGGSFAPENITSTIIPKLIQSWELEKSIHRVTMVFDPINYGIIISRINTTTGVNLNYWFDLTTGGFYPETYPEECAPYSMIFNPSLDPDYKTLLFGCRDGYVRKMSDTTKNDDTGVTTEAISSYVGMVSPLGTDDNTFGKMEKISGIVSGGESSGEESDSDAVGWACYRGNDAETVLERMEDGETAFKSGTWSTTGKQGWNRVKMRGVWSGVKLSNSTASRTWVVEKVLADVVPAGRNR